MNQIQPIRVVGSVSQIQPETLAGAVYLSSLIAQLARCKPGAADSILMLQGKSLSENETSTEQSRAQGCT